MKDMMSKFKLYILLLMKDKRNGFYDVIVKSVLRLLSWIYRLSVNIIDLTYKSGLRYIHKIDVPVISIGNLTLGGTGKTPFAVFLADYLQTIGRKPAILIRGYGADEHRMLKDELPDVPVFVGQNRVKSARNAVSEGRDIIILDDGFQHRRIGRDLDILMLDSVSLFGNEALFPRGVLREPVSSIKRADFFLLTKVDRIDTARKKALIRMLKEKADRPIVFSQHKPSFLTDVTGAAYSLNSLAKKKICLLSGIGDPDYFAFLLERTGAVIILRHDYADHHRYNQRDIDRIFRESTLKKADSIVTTAKDYAKIKKLDLSDIEEKLFILNIVIDIVEGKERLIAGLNSIIFN